MKFKIFFFTAFLAINFSCLLLCETLEEKSFSADEIPYKQVRGRLKAIARDFMINKQQIHNPFQLNQNWKKIKPAVKQELNQYAYLNDKKQQVVNQDAIPGLSDNIFKKLAFLQAETGETIKRKKYVEPETISIKSAQKIVLILLRKNSISIKDRKILLPDIMNEINKHLIEDKKIEVAVVYKIADTKINKFKDIKKFAEQQRGYLHKFLIGWKERFEDQIATQDWSAE